MSVHRAFAKFYKAERDRSEKALVEILDILCMTGVPADQLVDAALTRLEAHWGRYDEPGSLAPLGDARCDAGLAGPQIGDQGRTA